MMIGTLVAIQRYPVKSLRGESLEETPIGADGLPGDRAAAYVVTAGHARVGKTYRGKENDRLHLVDADLAVRDLAGNVQLERRDGQRFFDDAPVSLLVDRWLDGLNAHVGYCVEPQRFRPNLVIAAAPEFAQDERALEGRTLALGTVTLQVRAPIKRCVVTTYDPQGGPSDPRILQYVAQRRDNVMGLYCDVVVPGIVCVGDSLTSQ